MFERFTDRARRAVMVARSYALGSPEITSRHLLTALASESVGGVAHEVLADLAITPGLLRVDRAAAPTHAGLVGDVLRPFSTDAKLTLEGALREALQLGHNYVGTEHLLLAMTRPQRADVLDGLVSAETLRRRIIERLVEETTPVATPRAAETAPSPFVPHHFVSTAYGTGDKRLTLGALEALCAAARAGGARPNAPVNAEPGELVYGMPRLRITWSG